jgi:hypothetical protein
VRWLTTWLDRLTGGRADGTEFYDLAERTRGVPAPELAVVEAALRGSGPLGARILRQLREAPSAYRLRSDDGTYELRVATYDHLALRDAPSEGWVSDWIPITTADTARSIELRVCVDFGLAMLRGRTTDGTTWPRVWEASSADIKRIASRAPRLALPTPQELRAARAGAAATVARWLGDTELLRGRRGIVTAGPAATNDDVRAFESRERFTLPEAYRSLVLVANGIRVGRLDVLGMSDAYRLDMPGPASLVIAAPDEDGALVIDEAGAVVWVEMGAATTEGRVVAPDLRAYATAKLRRAPGSHRRE